MAEEVVISLKDLENEVGITEEIAELHNEQSDPVDSAEEINTELSDEDIFLIHSAAKTEAENYTDELEESNP